jgi:hypothetical protein
VADYLLTLKLTILLDLCGLLSCAHKRPLTLVYRRLNQSTYTIAHHQSKHLHNCSPPIKAPTQLLTTNQSTYTMCSPPNLSVSPTQLLTTNQSTYTIAHHQSKHLHNCSPPIKAPTQLLTTNQSTYTIAHHPICSGAYCYPLCRFLWPLFCVVDYWPLVLLLNYLCI